MSTSSYPMNSKGFALLTRLFAGLKRAGRVIDVIWFQKNAEYARAVLARAAEDDDETVRQIGAELQEILRDFLAPPPPPAAPIVAAATSTAIAPATRKETATVAPGTGSDPADRYVGRLR